MKNLLSKSTNQGHEANTTLAAGAHNIDFGLNDDSGNKLFVGDSVSIKSKTGDWQKTVKLEYKHGVFGFKGDDGKNLIPIAWHIGYSSVNKI